MDHTFAQSDNTNHMMTMKVSFREAARGGERRIRVRLKDQCPICSGKSLRKYTDCIDHKVARGDFERDNRQLVGVKDIQQRDK